ncbi:C-type lectin domain family 4 member E [Amia ocellicauda]|uniref:C-type lectin domain family 4 member E n=1 Tax=Amia ocellicauda TaxID=2972642 RepID=UPI003463A9B8
MDVLYAQVNIFNKKGKERKLGDTAEHEVTYSEVQTAGQNSSQSPIVPDNTPPKTAEGQAASRPYLTISLAVLCCLLAAIIIALAVLLHRSQKDKTNAEEISQLKKKLLLQLNISLTQGMTGYFCQKPWVPFHNRCYFFSTDEMNWTSSRDNCSSKQGHLVIIETAEEQKFIEHHVSRPNWIGLTDLKKTGDWCWVDDTALGNLRYWSDNQPDNYDKYSGTSEVEHCAVMRDIDGLNNWNDALCSHNKGRVCEKEAEKLET